MKLKNEGYDWLVEMRRGELLLFHRISKCLLINLGMSRKIIKTKLKF